MSDTDKLSQEPYLEVEDDAALEGDEASGVSAEEAALVTFDFDTPLSSEFGLKVQAAADAIVGKETSNSLRNYSSGRRDAFAVNWRLLKMKPGWNKRLNTAINREEIVLLAKNIAKVGVREPINVYMEDGSIYVSNGHRRLAAVRYAVEHLGATNVENLYVIAEDKKIAEDEAELLAVQLDSDHHQNKSPLERGLILARYQELKGLNKTQLGQRFDMKSQTVGHLLLLAHAPQEIHDLIISGAVSDSFARKTIQSFHTEDGHDYEKAYEVLVAAIEKAKAVGKEAATPKHARKEPAPKLSSDNLQPEPDQLPAGNHPSVDPERTDIEDFTGDVEARIVDDYETEAHASEVVEQEGEAPADDLSEQQNDIKADRKKAEREARIQAQIKLLSGVKDVLRGAADYESQPGKVVMVFEQKDFEKLIGLPLGL